MKPDKFKGFTFFDWNDGDRPELQIHGNMAILEIGRQHTIELKGINDDDLKIQLEGYADIFKAAAESLNN